MRAKLLPRIGLSLLIAVTTTVAGYLWLRNTNSAKRKLADTVSKSEYVFGQYFNADYDSARTAILDHVRFLDRLSSESENPLRGPYSVDAMTWLVRLAKLEDRHHADGGPGYMREACARCEKLGWADCSETTLRHEIVRMDGIALAQPH